MKLFNSNLWIAALACSTLVTGASAARGGETVVAAGDPPLTQNELDNTTRFRTWLLDIELSESGWKEYQRRLIAEWSTLPAETRNEVVQEAQVWGKFRKLKEDKQLAFRAEQQPPFLAYLRGAAATQSDKLLLEVYSEVHKVLAGGDIPLTQGTMWELTGKLEWLLDLSLTPPQRQEYERLSIEDWKRRDRASRENFLKDFEADRKALGKLRGYESRLLHAQRLPRFLEALRQTPGDEFSRWALGIFDTAHKPGGERNPVVAPGQPALTQEMLDRYCDYAEYMIDLSLSGGFTAQQRRVFQELLVNDWKKKDSAGKAEFTNVLKQWSEVSQSSDAERGKWFGALHPKLLAQLQAARDEEASRWLLAVYDNELKFAQMKMQGLELQRVMENARHETSMSIIRNMGSSGHYEFNPLTQKYDRWAP